MQAVFSPPRLARLEGGQAFRGPAPVGRALLLARKRLLQASGPRAAPRRLGLPAEQPSVRERDRIRHPAVDPDHAQISRRRGRGLDDPLGRQAGIPMPPVADDRHRLDAAFHPAVPHDADLPVVALPAPEFRRVQPALRQAELLRVGKAEAVPVDLPAEGRIGGGPREEVLIGPVEILQRLLQAVRRDLLQERERLLERRQLVDLRDLTDLPAFDPKIPTPMIPALFEPQIVDQPAAAGDLPEGFLLGFRRINPEPV